MAVEREYKFLLDGAAYGRLLGAVPWERALLQENVFFDTSDGALSRKRWALRLRMERGGSPDDAVRLAEAGTPLEEAVRRGWGGGVRCGLTLKGAARRSGAAVERVEIEERVSPGEAEVLRKGGWTAGDLGNGPVAAALAEMGAGGRPVEVVGRFANLRLGVSLEGADVVLDLSEAPDGRRRFEAEIETEGPVPAEFAGLLEEARARPSARGKFAWLLEGA